jgi:exodeoxyribonuclease VII large subunit
MKEPRMSHFHPGPALLPPGAKLLGISELTAQIQQLLEDAFPLVWVAGEVSNYKKHSSGHVYLTLKDSQAQIRAVIWRSVASGLRFELNDGLEVMVRGRIGVYAVRGDYQLYVEAIHPKGVGALELALQQLKEKLLQRGYFDPARKKPLPRFPQRVALVTSPTGAALRDLLQIISRRWPPAELWICPVRVQGEGAAAEIAAALRRLNRFCTVDVIVVGRGGGSLEDLWAFNEETVATAIFESRIPIISAVGHEIDFTIADLVADMRAATPSEAAEMVVPDREEFSHSLTALGTRLRLRVQERLSWARRRLEDLRQRRAFRQPLQQVRTLEQFLDERHERLQRAIQGRMDRCREHVRFTAARLETLSPLNVLGRGYSLTRKEKGANLIRSAEEVGAGERIVTRLARGQVVSRVEEIQQGQEMAHG